MHAIVVIEARTSSDFVCRIVDGTFDNSLSPPITLRFREGALADDNEFLTGRKPKATLSEGKYAAFVDVAVTLSTDGTPALIARSLVDPVLMTSGDFRRLTWTDVEEMVASESLRRRTDEGILYVDGNGAAFVIDSAGPYLHTSREEGLRTAQDCQLDGAAYPTAAGFYHFTGEPWSFVDPNAEDVDRVWGMTVPAYVPLTDAHLTLFGRTSTDELVALVEQQQLRAPVPSF